MVGCGCCSPAGLPHFFSRVVTHRLPFDVVTLPSPPAVRLRVGCHTGCAVCVTVWLTRLRLLLLTFVLRYPTRFAFTFLVRFGLRFRFTRSAFTHTRLVFRVTRLRLHLRCAVTPCRYGLVRICRLHRALPDFTVTHLPRFIARSRYPTPRYPAALYFTARPTPHTLHIHGLITPLLRCTARLTLRFAYAAFGLRVRFAYTYVWLRCVVTVALVALHICYVYPGSAHAYVLRVTVCARLLPTFTRTLRSRLRLPRHWLPFGRAAG